MFTGIIEEKGIVKSVSRSGDSLLIEISAELVFGDAKIGDSIAVNGICLTATKTGSRNASFFVMDETVRKTALKQLAAGSPVNLERALCLNSRLGGHIVSGHIDGTGKIMSIRDDGGAKIFTFSAAPEVMRYIVYKGSVAIDGISLTVMSVNDTSFSVSLIPHTLQSTALSEKKVGDESNIECDIIGKYIEKLMNGGGSRCPKESSITEQLLKEAGF